MPFVNLTNRTITLYRENEGPLTIPPSGIVATPDPKNPTESWREVEGVAIPAPGRILNLPDPVPGTIYLVTGRVRYLLANTRPDCVNEYRHQVVRRPE